MSRGGVASPVPILGTRAGYPDALRLSTSCLCDSLPYHHQQPTSSETRVTYP